MLAIAPAIWIPVRILQNVFGIQFAQPVAGWTEVALMLAILLSSFAVCFGGAIWLALKLLARTGRISSEEASQYPGGPWRE